MNKKKSDRKYYLKNKGRLLSQMALYAKIHKEELQSYYKEYMKDPQHIEEAKARSRKSYFKHKDKLMRGQRERNRVLKIEVLSHYGDGVLACRICDENRLACLSLDHIDNSGASHRRKLGREGMAFYRWIKQQEYPKGYQTLCMNCQWVKQDEVYKIKTHNKSL